MPVPQQNYVTKEEVENSYEFKLVKRIILREYPWIKDVVVPSDEEINEYNIIFLDIVMDPFELQRETGWPLASWIKFYLTTPNHPLKIKDYTYVSSYLSTMFDTDRDTVSPIHHDIEKTMRSVQKSPAIPSDLKLGKERSFAIGQYAIPQMDIPTDAVFRNKTT